MRPSSAKEKGRRFQQRVRDLFLKCAEALEPKDIRSVPMGVKGEDLWMSPRAEELFPYSVECKNRESLNIWEAIRQCRAEAKKHNKTPLVAFTKNHEETYIAIPIEHFLEILSSSWPDGGSDMVSDSRETKD